MTHSEFNPLQQELARSPLAGPHPDSDILAAFAEGSLLQRERAEVFAHLATCPDCREELSIATEAAPAPASGTKPFLLPRSIHQPSRAWIPWTSIAAGIIVVCSAGLLYKYKVEFKPRAAVATENAPATSSAIQQQKESSQPVEPALAPGKNATGSTTSNLKASVLAKESIVQKIEGQERSNLAVQRETNQQTSPNERSSTAVAKPEGVIAGLSAPAPASSSPAFAGAEPTRAMAKASVAGIARPHWRINSMGQAERSFGNEAWEAVLPNESARMRVVSVFNGDVWIGGENTRLYHSADNGFTWNLIALPEKDGQDHIIAHIRFQTSQSGNVEAADGTSWTTVDGGVSWN